jgi:replication-associated recombination protein RarA
MSIPFLFYLKGTHMLIKGTNYEPRTINDIVFGNDEARLRIEDIVHNIEEIPSSGKSAILLYGAYGTGKTTLAKMLPDNIEFGKTKKELVMPAEFIGCQQGFNGPQVMTLIETILGVSSLNASKIHYFILDEVDNLSKLAQQSLKSALNTTRGIFILTTNNVSELDRGLLDRCVLVEMNAAQSDQYLTIAKSIVSDFDVEIADEELLSVIRASNGSFRNLIHNIKRSARRMASL